MTDYYLQLIAKRLSNEINDFEQHELTEWIGESRENELFFRRIEESWSKGKYSLRIKNQEKVFEEISKAIGIDYKKDRSVSKKSPIKYWQRIAASVIILISSAVGWWSFNQGGVVGEKIPGNHFMVVKSNQSGQKSQITLPDGTKVKLNSDSYIEYPNEFDNERQVKLVGEAYFEVKRDSLHPFVVVTGDIQVKVLGTSFNVQAFPYEASMSVAVASGKVLVEKKNKLNDEQISTLLPTEMVRIDHKTGAFEKSRIDPNNAFAWRDGILIFEKAAFSDIIQRLERWYGVDIILERKTPISDGFTGRYENTTLEAVLEGMSFSSDFSFRIDGDTVFIK